jgi:hypothetical protein
MDNHTEQNPPAQETPVPTPVSEPPISPLSDAEPADAVEVLATEEADDVVVIEPREGHTDEMERHPRERRPQGHQGQGRHDQHGHQGHSGSHRPRPFVSDSRPRGVHAQAAKDAKREILVNCSPEETRVAVLENNLLIELLIERTESEKIVGNIYKGKIENVLPGISSAFVNVGLEKNAYLYVSDVIPTQGHSPSSQIEKMIARGETIMLQVAKEAIGTKGVKVTMDI